MARAFNYFRAAWPDPWQILGVRLLPFSLGHYLKLKRLGCAYVSDEPANATCGDLLLGVVVCSFPSDPDPSCDQFWAWFNRPADPLRGRIAKAFGKKPMLPYEVDIVRWGRKIGAFDVAEKAKLFAEYVSEYSAIPTVFELGEKDNAVQGTHWSHGVLNVLTSRCGYSQREAYNAPLCKAIADYYKFWESEGRLQIAAPEVEEAING